MCSFDFASLEGFLIFNNAVGCLAPLPSTIKEISAIISYTGFSAHFSISHVQRPQL